MPILTLITFVPILGAVIILFTDKQKETRIKLIGIVTTFICLLLSLVIIYQFDAQNPGFQMQERFSWIPALNIDYYMGVDGISVPMVFLTALLSFLAAIASWNISPRIKEYWVLYLLLETGMLGTFVSLDLFLFYIFWEVMLVPMYFLIGVWGGPRKEYAAIKFFLYTLAGSVFMLVGFLALYFASTPHTFSIPELAAQSQSLTTGLNAGISFFRFGGAQLVFLALFLGFAIKVPVFPFHTWLPDAHVEAPTPISVILAGILLKMGTYGFYRISHPILPQAAHEFAVMFAVLGVIGIIYGAFVAMAQQDFKKLVAYSSVSHMGFILLGLSAFTIAGWNGGYFQMFSHGLLTGGMFLLVGVLYDRAHTRDLNAFGGLGAKIPVYAGVLTVISLGSLGLPGMSGFVSEFMVLLGTYKVFPIYTIIAVIGIVLTAGYILYMLQRILLGPFNEKWNALTEINKRELSTLIPLIILTILIGVYPALLLNLINPTITTLIAKVGGVLP
ncbi:MAG: NADH-quinone oxidoreductase subunit M [bacterium]|nr:NADH-quinone oxidoreductase subunit M [bacterium]